MSFVKLGKLFAAGIVGISLVFVLVLFYSLNQLVTLKDTWSSFEHSRSDKIQAVTALHRVLGYGGMIHKYKNFVINKDYTLIVSIREHWGAAVATIDHYNTFKLSQEEEFAINQIHDVLYQYRSATETVRQLHAAGKPVNEIRKLVKIDDQPAFQGLETLDRFSAADLGREHLTSKLYLINKLRKTIGYGGFIHAFKDYAIETTAQYYEIAEQRFHTATKIIEAYREQNLSQKELEAIDQIDLTLRQYWDALAQISELEQAGITANVIHRSILIDDILALDAFALLNKEIVRESNERAELVGEIFESTNYILTAVILVATVIICFLVVMVLRIVTRQIVGPISIMTANMTALANGNINSNFSQLSNISEITAMDSALSIFRQNIKARNQAEANLRDREKLLSSIMNTVPDAIITVTNNWVISTANSATAHIFQRDVEQLLDKAFSCILSADAASNLFESWPTAERFYEMHQHGSWLTTTATRGDSETFPIEIALSPISGENIEFYTVVIRDISERLQIEKMKNEFVSTVSHELRTPLTSINGSLALLTGLGHAKSEQAIELVTLAQRNTDRLLYLVNDILDIGKLDSTDFKLDYADCDLLELAKQSIQDMEGFATNHQVTLKLEHNIQQTTYHGDYIRLLQALTNLLSNAIKYSPTDGEVKLKVEQMSKFYRFSVIDHGRGIPEEFKERIFNRFAQADASDKREQAGTGLGLNISQRIVELHFGKIGFHSQINEGSTFFFELPLAQD